MGENIVPLHLRFFSLCHVFPHPKKDALFWFRMPEGRPVAGLLSLHIQDLCETDQIFSVQHLF